MSSRCRSCQAPIRFVTTETGRPMPIDPEPHPDGNVVPVPRLAGDLGEPRARVLAGDELAQYAGDRWRAHFTTCPNASSHRRPR